MRIITPSSLSFTFLIFFLILQICCGSSKGNIDKVASHAGWVDDNTFIVQAIGKPVHSNTGEKERKNSAKRAAIANARFKILKKFKKTNKNAISSSPDNIKGRKMQALKIVEMIKKGKVIQENYDKRDLCEIIYQVQNKNLQKIVTQTDLSMVDIIN